MRRQWIFLISCIAINAQIAAADPIVIADHGGTPTGVPTYETVRQEYLNSAPVVPQEQAFNPYPILSEIKPGKLARPLKAKAPIDTPLFFIGPDDFSVNWAQQNKQYLLNIGAAGYATNLISEQQFIDLQNQIKPLPLAPMPLDQVAELFGIPVYPVLLFKEIRQ